MGILCGGSMVVCGGMVYWVYDFFFFGGGFTSGGVVCSAAVVEWGCWGFLFCFDFLWWVLWLMVVAFDLWLIFCCGMCGFDGGGDGFAM